MFRFRPYPVDINRSSFQAGSQDEYTYWPKLVNRIDDHSERRAFCGQNVLLGYSEIILSPFLNPFGYNAHHSEFGLVYPLSEANRIISR